MKEYRVSSVGQMTLPSEVRHDWGLMHRGAVETIDLGKSVLMIPQGTSYALIEQLYPESNLHQIGQEIKSGYERGISLEQSEEIEVFNAYKVSSVGQITLVADARHRWGLDEGGKVNTENLQTALLIMPYSGFTLDLAEHLPAGLFNSYWYYNRDGVLSRFLLEAYWEWIGEMAQGLKDSTLSGGMIEGTQRDDSALGRIMGEQIARSTLKLALKNLS